jgi:hypothetical protein
MDELQQKIVSLQNQIDQLSAQINNGLFSNTILQSKNLIQASGAMISPNFVSGSAGWSLDSLGNLEAQNGIFRGSISASSITGGTITGGAISGGTIDGTVITGGTIRTDDEDNFRLQIDPYGGAYFGNSIGWINASNARLGYMTGTIGGDLAFYTQGDTQHMILYKSGNGYGLELAGYLTPENNASYDLGLSFRKWRDAYFSGDLVAGTLSADNGDSGSFTAQSGETVTVVDGIITNIA